MIDNTQTLSRVVAYSIIGVGFMISIMLSLQLAAGFLTWDYYPAALYFAFVSNLAVIPILMFLATRYHRFLMPAIAWLHLSMGVVLLYFSQIYSPFTATWSILILLSSIYYGWKGFCGSSIGLSILAILYNLLFPELLIEESGSVVAYVSLSILVVALTVLTSYMFVTVIMGAKKKNDDLMKSQKSEFMQVTRLNTLLNSISDAVMTLNRYGRVTSQNAAAQAFFDTNESLIGRDINKLLELSDQSDKPVDVHKLISEVKNTVYRDDISVGKGNDLRRLSLQLARIRSTFDDDEEYGVVIIIRDITKQKTLEDEKDEFISVTSHELRTPVAIAEGSLSNILVMFERDMERKKIEDATKTAHEQIVYLAKMINDLSTLSRAERGVGDAVEVIDTDELVHGLYNRYLPEAEQKGLRLNLDADPKLLPIKTSRLYLEEILQNFITNAIKYTKEGSVTIKVSLLDGDEVRFAVTDTGIGISKPDQERIFEKFYRSEDYRTRETNGTGLGLYVVQKLASKLNVHISVESRLNFGSTFSFAMKGTNEDVQDELAIHEVEQNEAVPAS